MTRPWTTSSFYVLYLFLYNACATASDVEYANMTLSKLAFGSCHKRKYVDPSRPTIWHAIQNEQPDAFIWTGDAVYPPARGIASVELLKKEYDQLQHNTSLGYASLKPPGGIAGTWDDHDYGANDAGKEMPEKQERALAFLKFLDKLAIFDKTRGGGVYSSVEWGEAPQKVKAILLDTRSFRDYHCIRSVATQIPVLGAGIACITRWLTAGLSLPDYIESCRNKNMLGQEQWQWLERELQSSDAQIHVIVSSVQVLSTNPVMETWGHFPQERSRLLKLLSGVSGAVILSGDVHHAELLSPNIKSKNTFVEVTSSGLTHDCSKPFYGGLCKPLLTAFDAHRYQSKGNFYIGRNYGTLEVDWDMKAFEVLVHNDAGAIVLRTGSMGFKQDALSDVDVEEIAPVIDGHLVPKAQAVLIALAVGFFIHRMLRRRQGSYRYR